GSLLMRWILFAGLVAIGCGKQDKNDAPNAILPSDPAAGAGMPQPKGATQGSAAFDPEDAGKTLRWIAEQYQESRALVEPGDAGTIASWTFADEVTTTDGVKYRDVRVRAILDNPTTQKP